MCGPNNDACSSADTAGIGQENLIIMSGSGAAITAEVGGAPATSIDLTGGSETVVFQIGDARNQPMPAGTTITLETTNGEIVGPSSFDQPCTASLAPIPYAFTLSPDDTAGESGVAFLTVTTPGGIVTTVNLPVDD